MHLVGQFECGQSPVSEEAAHVVQGDRLARRMVVRGHNQCRDPPPQVGIGDSDHSGLPDRRMGGEVFLDDVFVPDSQILGTEHQGFKVLVASLNNERIMAGALALGMIDGILDESVDYAKNRSTFGKVIGGHQIIQHYVADTAIAQKQAELLTFDAAWREASGVNCHKEANVVKVVTSELAVAAADRGIQILGGMGISSETHAQRFWRDLRQFRIAPISNEMVRNNLAETYGLPRSY